MNLMGHWNLQETCTNGTEQGKLMAVIATLVHMQAGHSVVMNADDMLAALNKNELVLEQLPDGRVALSVTSYSPSEIN